MASNGQQDFDSEILAIKDIYIKYVHILLVDYLYLDYSVDYIKWVDILISG